MFHAALILQLQVICDALHKLAFSLPFLYLASWLPPAVWWRMRRPVNIICHSTAATRERHSLSHIKSKLDEKRFQRVFGQDGTCFVQMVVCEYCQREVNLGETQYSCRWGHSQMGHNTLAFSSEKGWDCVLTEVRKVLLRSMWAACVFALLSRGGEGVMASCNCNSQSLARCWLISFSMPVKLN